MEHVECIMTSSTNSCTPESGVENLHQIQRETGGLDNIPTLCYSYNHKVLRMQYSVLSFPGFRLSMDMCCYICRFGLFILYLFQWLGWKGQIG